MSLQIGPVLRSGGEKLFSRTGAVLLAAYAALTAAILPLSNTMIVRLYERAGLTEATEAIPLVLDVPLSVAVEHRRPSVQSNCHNGHTAREHDF